MKQAILTIETVQPLIDEKLTFSTRADCEEGEGGMHFTYEENLSEEDSVLTHLTVSDDSVTVQRDGTAGSDMFFKKTTTYETVYRVSGLCLDMKIFTTNLNIALQKTGLSADIAYELYLAGNDVGRMGMTIKAEYL